MSSAQTGGVAKAQLSNAAAGSQVQQLTLQIKQMKKTMIEYAGLLDDPQWKQQQPDSGKAVSRDCTCMHSDYICHALAKGSNTIQVSRAFYMYSISLCGAVLGVRLVRQDDNASATAFKHEPPLLHVVVWERQCKLAWASLIVRLVCRCLLKPKQ